MKLEYPVTVDGVTYEEVTLRRMKGADMLKVEQATRGKSEAEGSFAMIALLGDVPEAVVLEMDAADIMKLSEEVATFLPTPARLPRVQ